MKKLLILGTVLLIIVLVSVIPNRNQIDVADDPIRIGATLSLTGIAATYGEHASSCSKRDQ